MSAPAVLQPAVREAGDADSAALLELAAACPMQGDIGLCLDRAPDFFALHRLEPEAWTVGVVDAGGGVAGCVAVAERTVHLHGRPARTCYVGDLKVHPSRRGGGVADALTRWARERCVELAGEHAPVLITVLAGNHAMERRTPGPRDLPRFTRFATLRSYSIPLLWKRRAAGQDVRISVARESSLEEMAELWRRVAPARQLAPVMDAEGLAAWIRAAPGLQPSSYLLARRRDGSLVGFLGLWDQSSVARLRVTRYSPRLRVVRALYNSAAAVLRAAPLPPPGEALRCVTAVHVCVPPDRPEVLRALLLAAGGHLHGRGFSFLNLGLDARDPLGAATRGLLAQPTDVHAYVTTPAGPLSDPRLGERPLHFEISLV